MKFSKNIHYQLSLNNGWYVLLFIFFFTGTISAQLNKINGGFGHMAMSAEQINISGLNKSLNPAGYGSFDEVVPSFGGGGAFVVNRFVVGGNGAWVANSTAVQDGNTSSLKGGYGFLNGGYVIFAGKHAVFYPSLGIGGAGYNISLYKQNVSPDFTTQINTPSGSLNANAGGWLGSIQLSYFYFLHRGSREGFFIGLRAGYKYSSDWKVTLNATNLKNSPALNMNGVFFSILFGGGSLLQVN